MMIHELNAGTMRPPWLGESAAPFVCRCLLIEAAPGLLLVDAGIGTHDIASPSERLGDEWVAIVGPRLDPAETLLHQLAARGYRPEDVGDILITHHHGDHVGGLADFPHARVHCLPQARQAVLAGLREPDGPIRAAQWRHKPQWAPAPTPAGEMLGLPTFIAHGIDPRIRFVPLPGHSQGHAGVLVRRGSDRWLLHAGDAAFHPHQYAGGHVPAEVIAFVEATQHDPQERARSEEILVRLNADPRVEIITAHGPCTR